MLFYHYLSANVTYCKKIDFKDAFFFAKSILNRAFRGQTQAGSIMHTSHSLLCLHHISYWLLCASFKGLLAIFHRKSLSGLFDFHLPLLPEPEATANRRSAQPNQPKLKFRRSSFHTVHVQYMNQSTPCQVSFLSPHNNSCDCPFKDKNAES